MPNEVDRIHNANILNHYDTQDGFLIIQLGVSLTATYEPDGEKALRAVADKADRFLVPCVKVRSKGRR